jgi:hypothetical protein
VVVPQRVRCRVDHLGSGRILASEKRGARYVSESLVKRMSGDTKRQCDRALRPRASSPALGKSWSAASERNRRMLSTTGEAVDLRPRQGAPSEI